MIPLLHQHTIDVLPLGVNRKAARRELLAQMPIGPILFYPGHQRTIRTEPLGVNIWNNSKLHRNAWPPAALAPSDGEKRPNESSRKEPMNLGRARRSARAGVGRER